MLVSLVLELLRNASPLLTVKLDILNDSEVFGLKPVFFEFGRVQMIEPSFPTLFGSPEIFFIRFDVKSLSEVTPPQSVFVPLDKFLEKLVFLVNPFLVLIMILKKVAGLILK